MNTWLRETAGWLLLGTGVAVFGLVYAMLANRRLLECGPLTFVGWVLFRGGLHLVRLTAAEKAVAAADPKAKPAASPARRFLAARTAARPGELSRNVVPGAAGPRRPAR